MRWLGDTPRLTGAFQSTRAPRLRSATTPSQTRRALCFPSTTAMAASSSGDFATHQMQLRRQRRFCSSDVPAITASSVITASFTMVEPFVMATSFVMAASFAMAASSASRDYAKHSIMNASVSFSFWHKFSVVNDGFFGTQKALYKRPGQKRGTCQGVQKSPSARRKIVHNRKFVPESPKSGRVFAKTETRSSKNPLATRSQCTLGATPRNRRDPSENGAPPKIIGGPTKRGLPNRPLEKPA